MYNRNYKLNINRYDICIYVYISFYIIDKSIELIS